MNADRAVPPRSLPHVIVLNGASSAGKTALARSLQEALPALFLNFSIDSLLYAMPPSDLAAMIEGRKIERRDYDYSRLVGAYHAAAAALVDAGCRLILDNAWTRPEWRADLAQRLSSHRVIWVGVRCDPAMLRERERARGDRAPGMAERENAVVHQGLTYALEVDTTERAPAECAADIVAFLTA